MSTFPRQILPKGEFDNHEAADDFVPSESARQTKKTSTACSGCKHAKRKVSKLELSVLRIVDIDALCVDRRKKPRHSHNT